MVGIVARGPARDDGRLLDRLRSRARRAPGAARTPRRKAAHGPRADRTRRPLVPALRRAGGAVRAHDAARPRVRVAARGRREDAARALHGALADRHASRGCSALALAGHALGSDWTSVRKGFEYVDYAIVVAGRDRDRLRDRAPATARPADDRRPADRRRRMPLGGSRCRLLAAPRGRRSASLQGPTELLPVSSSAHTTLLPWLAGWPYAELDAELRKSFEVALHAGAGAGAGARHARASCSTSAPADSTAAPDRGARAVAGPARARRATRCGRAIERRLGGPRSIAAGLLAGALAMALADCAGRARTPGQRERPAGQRGRATRRGQPSRATGSRSALAQAAALIPGVSRSGATLTAARARGFGRADAHALSWHAGAAGDRSARARCKGGGCSRRRRPATAPRRRSRPARASAFVSTLRAPGCCAGRGVSARALLPYAALPLRARRASSLVRAAQDSEYERMSREDRAPRDANRARHTARRALPARRGDRARRHVDRLPRVRHRARAAGRDQADAPRDRRRLRPARALPPRGARGRAAQPPAHRHRDRRRRGALRGRRGDTGHGARSGRRTSCSSTSTARRSSS